MADPDPDIVNAQLNILITAIYELRAIYPDDAELYASQVLAIAEAAGVDTRRSVTTLSDA